MQAELRRVLLAPMLYWRTVLLVWVVGLLVTTLSRDATAVLLSTLVSAFVFSSYDRRRWVVMPTDVRVGDTIVRLAIALGTTYVMCSPNVNPAFRLTALL